MNGNGPRSYAFYGLLLFLEMSASVVVTMASDDPPLPDSTTIGRDDIVEIARAALLSVDTIEHHVRVYRHTLVPWPGAEDGPRESQLFHEFDYGWDRLSGKRYVKGREYVQDESGNSGYRQFWGAYDGERLRTFGTDLQRGQILAMSWQMGPYWSMRELLGIGIGSVAAPDLADLLKIADVAESQEASQQGYVALRAQFERVPGNPATKHVLETWLDPRSGFLPARIAVIVDWSGTLYSLVENIECQQLDNGSWIPVVGTMTLFAVSERLPKGLSREAMNRLSDAELAQATKSITYYATPLEPPSDIVIDAKSCIINESIPEDRFSITFPDGSQVWDEFARTVYIVRNGDFEEIKRQPTVGLPNSTRADGSSRILTVVLTINIAAIVVFGIISFLRRRTKKRCQEP